MQHELKILPQYFQPVVEGRKTFEIRRNDRGFQAGDTVVLREWRPPQDRPFGSGKDGYTGASHIAKIGYVATYQQQPDYVVFSLLPV